MERLHVLVVEDHQDSVKMIRISLGVMGFRVSVALSGTEALAKIEADPPDVILLDLRMPYMDGFQFMRTYAGPIPIIIYSGWTDMKDLPREPYAKFIKPADMREIAQTMHNAVMERRTQ